MPIELLLLPCNCTHTPPQKPLSPRTVSLIALVLDYCAILPTTCSSLPFPLFLTAYGVSRYGPTIFSDIISAACAPARTVVTQQRQEYSLLFILTDGVIADMQQTIDQIVGASHLPLSVVIVGIGGEDFSKMVSKNESSTAGTAVYNNACKGRQRHKKKKRSDT